MNKKQFIESQIKMVEDPYQVEIYRILLEADIQWLDTQSQLILHLLNDPQIEQFGKQNFKGWSQGDTDFKANKLFSYFNENGALEEARKYIESAGTVVSKMIYDIPDITEPYNGIKSEHLKQLKDSKIFNDLIQILLKNV